MIQKSNLKLRRDLILISLLHSLLLSLLLSLLSSCATGNYAPLFLADKPSDQALSFKTISNDYSILLRQELLQESPLQNPNLGIMLPFPENHQAVLDSWLVSAKLPHSPWRIQQWRNTDSLTQTQTLPLIQLEEVTGIPQLSYYLATKTAHITLTHTFRETWRTTFEVDNQMQSRDTQVPQGACFHDHGGSNYFLTQDLMSVSKKIGQKNSGWYFNFKLSDLELSHTDHSPCQINAAQGFLGLIFKVHPQDPKTLFYQIHFADSRQQLIGHYDYFQNHFAGMPLSCLIGRGVEQFPNTQGEYKNQMHKNQKSLINQGVLSITQMETELKRCFDQVDVDQWYIESIYFGLELDGWAKAKLSIDNLQVQLLYDLTSKVEP